MSKTNVTIAPNRTQLVEFATTAYRNGEGKGQVCYTPVGVSNDADLPRLTGALYTGTKTQVVAQLRQRGYISERVALAKIAGRGRPSTADSVVRLTA